MIQTNPFDTSNVGWISKEGHNYLDMIQKLSYEFESLVENEELWIIILMKKENWKNRKKHEKYGKKHDEQIGHIAPSTQVTSNEINAEDLN